jgi:aspartate beta-hydroxylase
MTSQPIDPRSENAAGMAALRNGDFAIAERHFIAAATADPQAAALWRNLAHARRELGNDDGEAAALDAAIAADRRDFAAWLRKAQLHSRRRQDAEAMAAWSGVLQMAAAIEEQPPALAAQLAEGAGHLAILKARLDAAVDGAISEPIAALPSSPRRRAQAFVDSVAGRRTIYRNECAGLHYPFLPADEFFDDHHFPWFADLARSTDAIRDELLALIADPGEALRPYVRLDPGTPQNKWSGLDQSLDWGACFLWEYGRPNQPVLDRCPATAAALAAVPQAAIPDRAPSAFFSMLRPRTCIPPHTGVSNTRAIIHLPLIVPDACGFRVGGEIRQWQVGQPFAFDDTIEHEAWNDSDAMRAVLIFDVWNPHLSVEEQAIIARYYAAADASGLNPERPAT